MKIENIGLKFSKALTPIKKVGKLVLHHPAHETWSVEDIHKFHQQSKGWLGIGYNYFIGFDGRIYEGRGKNVGAHCEGHNSHTLGICFQGNFQTQRMTDSQIDAGGWLIALLMREYGLSLTDVVGHKDMPGASTACPGKNFRMNDVKQSALEWTNPNVKKEVAGVSYVDPQPPQYFRIETGEFATEEDAEKALEGLKKVYSFNIRQEGKRIVSGTWTDASIPQKYKDEWKRTYKYWVYLRIV